jgi:hypothetical protein
MFEIRKLRGIFGLQKKQTEGWNNVVGKSERKKFVRSTEVDRRIKLKFIFEKLA